MPIIYLSLEKFIRKISCECKYPMVYTMAGIPGSVRKRPDKSKVKEAKKKCPGLARAGSCYHPKPEGQGDWAVTNPMRTTAIGEGLPDSRWNYW